MAVQQANKVLWWMENLLVEDRPPRCIWHLDDELNGWFEAVNARHEQGRTDADGDETVPMLDNELAKGRG